MVKHFDDDPTVETRALQIWQILIARAANRQTITYTELAKIIGYKKTGQFFAQLLDPIRVFCMNNGLPALTSLVIQKDTGRPGAGLQNVSDPNAERCCLSR